MALQGPYTQIFFGRQEKKERAREGGRDSERHREKLNSQGQQTI